MSISALLYESGAFLGGGGGGPVNLCYFEELYKYRGKNKTKILHGDDVHQMAIVTTTGPKKIWSTDILS